jgi:predicted PurR-regulated permease PerM
VQILTSSAVALVTFAALKWMAVEQPAAWGVFAGLMNLVPYFGPLIVTGVLTAVAFLQFGAVATALAVGAVTLLITTLEGNFLMPKLLSRAASLNLVSIFVSIMFWSWVWGAAGMLLAVPILMAVKVVSDRVDELAALSLFLGD